MSLIRLEDVSLEFARHYLFEHIDITVEHNSRIGLIGPNGCGKTTLLKIMLGEMDPSEGNVHRSKSMKVAYLSQNPEFDSILSAEEYVRSARSDIHQAWQEIMLLSAQAEHNDALLEQLHKAEEKFHHLGGYEFDTQMKLTLTALKFEPEVWGRQLNSFSGGERTRLALAHILLGRYDLLMMDEPTNHLDIAMTQWLESYLNSQPQPYLIISHDRTFLDRTVSTIYSVENRQIHVTKGNYTSWYEAHKIRLLEQERQWKRQQKWLKDTQDFIARNMAGQKTKQAQSRLKTLNRTSLIDKPKQAKSLRLDVSSDSRSGNDVYRLEDMSFGIGDKVLAKEINLYCGYQDRICLLGQNGSGKTTLLKLLLGDKQPLSGKVQIGASLDIGYYDQYQNELDISLTVYDTLKQLVPTAPEGYILGWLARFGFTDLDVKKTVSVLSGGEKSRLYLSVLIHEKPNLLILDEPTNHLDISMMDSLLDALQDYDGTVVFVSHDRYFIKELTTKYWVFHKKVRDNTLIPTVEEIDKPFEEVLSLAYSEPQVEKPKTEMVNNRVKKVNPWVLEQLQKEIESKHVALSDYQKRLDEIHHKLADSSTYAQETLFKQLQNDMKDTEVLIAETEQAIDSLETRYLELSYDPAG